MAWIWALMKIKTAFIVHGTHHMLYLNHEHRKEAEKIFMKWKWVFIFSLCEAFLIRTYIRCILKPREPCGQWVLHNKIIQLNIRYHISISCQAVTLYSTRNKIILLKPKIHNFMKLKANLCNSLVYLFVFMYVIESAKTEKKLVGKIVTERLLLEHYKIFQSHSHRCRICYKHVYSYCSCFFMCWTFRA